MRQLACKTVHNADLLTVATSTEPLPIIGRPALTTAPPLSGQPISEKLWIGNLEVLKKIRHFHWRGAAQRNTGFLPCSIY